jgi:hypothetical protein
VHIRFWSENAKGYHLGHIDVDGRLGHIGPTSFVSRRYLHLFKIKCKSLTSLCLWLGSFYVFTEQQYNGNVNYDATKEIITQFLICVYLWLCSPLLNLGRIFSFLILYTIDRTPWTSDQPVARPLCTHRTTQTQNKRTQISTP